MAQKVNEGDIVTWRHMHAILRWPKIRTIQFLFDFGSKYQSRVKILRWPTFFSSKILRWPKIRREMVFEAEIVRILGHLRIFELKKVGHLRILLENFNTWLIFRAKIKKKLNGSNFGLFQNRMHMPSCDNISFVDFLGHLGDPP